MIREKDGPAYFGNEKIIIKAINGWTTQSVNLLIKNTLKRRQIEWNVPSLLWSRKQFGTGFEEFYYQPFIKLTDEEFNKKKHLLYTIPYFSSNSDAVVIAIGESGNHGGGHGYLVFDINGDYEIINGMKVSYFYSQ